MFVRFVFVICVFTRVCARAQDEQMGIIHLESLAIKQAFFLYQNEDGSRKPAPHDKMSAYLEDQLRRKDAELNKLDTKNKGLRNTVSKMKGAASDLRMKEEGGDTLKPIDLDQLQIENNQLLETIQLRNAQVSLLPTH